MDINLNKSTPRYIQLGTQDNSPRALPPVVETRPQHYPIIMSFSGRGTAEPQHVNSLAYVNKNFGAETMDKRGMFFNHQLLFMEKMLGEGNTVMFKRLIPAGATKAMLRLSVEVLFDEIDDYQRDETTGMYLLDANGDPISQGTMNGYRLKWLVNHQNDTVDFGQAQPVAGTMQSTLLDGSNVPLGSQIYPIMDFEVATEGLYGDNTGIRISPASNVNGALDAGLATQLKSLFMSLQVVERDALTQTPVIQRTLGGDTQVTLAVGEDLYNPVNDLPISIDNAFIDSYTRHNVPGQPNELGHFGRVYVYQTEWNQVVDLLINSATDVGGTVGQDYDGEAAFDAGNYVGGTPSYVRDGLLAVADTTNSGLLNILTGEDADEVPYFAFVVESDSLTFTLNSSHYAVGGDDGDLSAKSFDLAYRAACLNFGNETDYPMKNFVKYPFTHIWDTGFSMTTKYAICNVMGVRRDVMPIFTTHSVFQPTNELDESQAWEYPEAMSETEENARGELLLSRIRLTPESEYFGTKTFRAMIFGQSGKLLEAGWRHETPLSLQYAVALSRFAGALNGRWSVIRNPNVGDNKKITLFKNVSNTYADETLQDKAWGACINKARDYDTTSYFWPALTTVCDDKTSVLANPNAALAANTLYKICYKAWRNFVGDDTRTADQLVKDSDLFIDEEVSGEGIFGDIVLTIPQTVVTPDDSIRGYTWHTTVRIGLNNMRLVGVYTIEANRLEDMFL